jgi:hypothetical protein
MAGRKPGAKTMVVQAIERPAAKSRRKAQAAPEPAEKGLRFNLRMNSDWRDWCADYAETRRVSVATLIDHALAALAKADGHAPPPKR